MEIRKAREKELENLHRFSVENSGLEESFEEFRERYSSFPDLFIVCTDGSKLIGGATGKKEDDGSIGLQSIAVKHDRRSEGIGSDILNFFEEKAENYGTRVSVGAANNIEDFYVKNGYHPVTVLLKVEKDDLPDNYREKDRFLSEREVDKSTIYIYLDFREYTEDLRDRLKEEFNAFQANTIYEKKL